MGRHLLRTRGSCRVPIVATRQSEGSVCAAPAALRGRRSGCPSRHKCIGGASGKLIKFNLCRTPSNSKYGQVAANTGPKTYHDQPAGYIRKFENIPKKGNTPHRNVNARFDGCWLLSSISAQHRRHCADFNEIEHSSQLAAFIVKRTGISVQLPIFLSRVNLLREQRNNAKLNGKERLETTDVGSGRQTGNHQGIPYPRKGHWFHRAAGRHVDRTHQAGDGPSPDPSERRAFTSRPCNHGVETTPSAQLLEPRRRWTIPAVDQ